MLQRRKPKIRKKISSPKQRLRLSIFRSNKYTYAQIIDDQKGQTLLSVSEKELKVNHKMKVERALELGKLIAKKAKSKKISKLVFDRNNYKYHGRVKALAEGAREGGLIF